ncbi:hypothetical protein KEM09_08995 [Carboxylicivirga mesophila]|uniref:DUF4234 domain-containing protein n=1 Tax=Carboxylicivirga mesophila TaxID=1166478 RepID=A0ABS5K966_9BACT|nr:hypothetical protein [Carboxylicivirga mesophila]MBS2211536.1 hypothetical protein [Carboxylicivirga mesophila]
MRFILKLKHWQLFLLLFLGTGVGSIGTIICLNTIFNLGLSITESIIPLVISYFLWGSWMVTSIGLLDRKYKALSEKQKMIVKYGTVFLICTALRLLNTEFVLIPLAIPNGLSFLISFILYFGGAFLFYYFIFLFSKGLAISKYGANWRAGDLIIQLLRILFFPIGIWTLQPELNKLYRAEKSRNAITP